MTLKQSDLGRESGEGRGEREYLRRGKERRVREKERVSEKELVI